MRLLDTMKYRVLIDYRTDGWAFRDGEFETVDEAVKEAVANVYGNPFLIVNVIDWSAEVKSA